MMRSFGDAIRNGKITLDIAIDKQEQLAKKIKEFISKKRRENLKMKKENLFKIVHWHSSKEEKWSLMFLEKLKRIRRDK